MSKRWMAVALVVMSLGQTARAQSLPSPAPAVMPEPIPYGPSPQMVPGPISPLAAPPGPGPDLSIPGNIPGAFDEGYLEPKHCFFHIGAMALQRRHPGHFNIAILDPNNLDTGASPLLPQPVAVDLSQVGPDYGWGVRGTVGWMRDGCALELTGYYIWERTGSFTVSAPGQLSAPFVNPPLGFEGNNNLWAQADTMTPSISSTLANGEFNVRWWSKAIHGAEGIVGIRYFDLQERFSLFTDDDGLVIQDVFGNPDPLRQATYSTRAHSRILGPQFGLEWSITPCCWLAMGLWGKGMWGLNWADVDVRLTRGDGFEGIKTTRSHTMFSQLYDVAGYVELHLLDRLRVRAAYNALWLLHVPVASQQVDFNLIEINGFRKDNGSLFYHGPLIEVQFLF